MPMTEPTASILAAAEDRDGIQAMALPVSLIVAAGAPDAPEFLNDQGQALPPDQVLLRCIGCLPLSEAGHSRLVRCTGWLHRELELAETEELLAVAAPTGNRAEVLEWLVAQLAADRRDSARRATRLLRELSLLRRQHEETQASFHGLEQFVWRHGMQQRTLGTTLSPIAGQLPLTLPGGARLRLRLPGASPGLSDLALHLADAAGPAEGVLNVGLRDPGAGETLAVWEVPAAQLEGGWLRLSLSRALGPDPVSLELDVSYQGRGAVRLSTALRHPEPRFRPEVEGRTIETLPALQIWRWIAGARPPAPARALLEMGGKDRLRRVSPDTLATAIDLETLQDRVPLVEARDALLVHVMPQRVACAIIQGLALPGVRQVFAALQTRHAEAPSIEYQLALLPTEQRPQRPGSLPPVDPRLGSGWIRLAPMELGQAHILLPEPLGAPHDIYLMTRLPAGQDSNHCGWSTFSDLCLQF